MSNFKANEGHKLAIELARELSELTGESPSCLYAWAGQHDLPPRTLGSRQTFYSQLKDQWTRKSSRTLTQDCRLGSRPFHCCLRLRAVSLLTQFRRDKHPRQIIILFGYEACSGFLHFRLYRGTNIQRDNSAAVTEQIPVETVAEFVKECGQMIGLPLERVLFTQKLFAEPVMRQGFQVYLSLADKKLHQKARLAEPAIDELRCGITFDQESDLASFATLPASHPFSSWCELSNAKRLTDKLSAMVNRHNKHYALSKIEVARNKLATLIGNSAEGHKDNTGGDWNPDRGGFSLLELRLCRHEYLVEYQSLDDVGRLQRDCEDFGVFPGDRCR